MTDYNAYETIIGLEVHARLLTQSKLFCGDATGYGAAPNTQVSPLTLAHPGTLPKLNQKAIELAVRMGLATHSDITRENYFSRKNYFYPDLPKGYQVTQHTTPVCTNGYIEILSGKVEKRIRLSRIHLEEDAGKSLHDPDPDATCLDFNRAGTALIEIVSEPDLRSGEEAYAYLTAVRQLLRYLEVCDGNMEEGSLRCDANISVRKKGETALGTRTEIKNLNSIRNIRKAIDTEAMRQMDLLDEGKKVVQQTRSYDAASGTSFPLRDKEDADDYRYFPEPDLPPFQVQEAFIDAVRASLPLLPGERMEKYKREYGLSVYDTSLLTEEKNFADYFESLVRTQTDYKAAANWMLGPVKNWLNENGKEMGEFPVSPHQMGELIGLVQEGRLSFTTAAGKLFPQMIRQPHLPPAQIAEQENLLQESDAKSLSAVVEEVLAKMSDKVTAYQKGKKGLLALFVGEVMKRTGGKADPKITNELLREKLKS